MKYIERILLHDKKRIAETQKVKEELEKKELKECTFKPKINQVYVNKKEKIRIKLLMQIIRKKIE